MTTATGRRDTWAMDGEPLEWKLRREGPDSFLAVNGRPEIQLREWTWYFGPPHRIEFIGMDGHKITVECTNDQLATIAKRREVPTHRYTTHPSPHLHGRRMRDVRVPGSTAQHIPLDPGP